MLLWHDLITSIKGTPQCPPSRAGLSEESQSCVELLHVPTTGTHLQLFTQALSVSSFSLVVSAIVVHKVLPVNSAGAEGYSASQ